jgi:hypothetical protein
MKQALFAFALLLVMAFAITACNKKPKPGPKPEPVETVEPQLNPELKLLEQFRSGEIDKCKDPQGNVVYRCQRNIRDIETRIFDAAGNQIGVCFYSTRKLDPICEQTTDCKTIYRVANNIWGKPAVNEIEK